MIEIDQKQGYKEHTELQFCIIPFYVYINGRNVHKLNKTNRTTRDVTLIYCLKSTNIYSIVPYRIYTYDNITYLHNGYSHLHYIDVQNIHNILSLISSPRDTAEIVSEFIRIVYI